MAGKKKNIMNSIKRAISPLRPRVAADEDVFASLTICGGRALTRFVMDKLTGPSKELFALSFAMQMKVDIFRKGTQKAKLFFGKHALVVDLTDCLSWLGMTESTVLSGF